jgi:hypothetical protein
MQVEEYKKDVEENLRRLRFSLESELYMPYSEKRIDVNGRNIFLSWLIVRVSATLPDEVQHAKETATIQ